MGRNEIRLRRQMMSAGRIARHRNYGEILQRHEHEMKLKRITRLVTYFLIVCFIVILYFIINRWEQREEQNHQDTAGIPTQVDAQHLPYGMTDA